MKTLKFDGVNGSHCGLTDLYPENLAKLQEALASGEDFTTDWWSSKKEIQSAKVTRQGNHANIQVTCGMDDGPDLVGTAVWEALGGNEFAGSGYEAMRKKFPGITEERIEEAFEMIQNNCGVTEENSVTLGGTSASTEEAIMEMIDTLASTGQEDLEQKYQSIVEYVREVYYVL